MKTIHKVSLPLDEISDVVHWGLPTDATVLSAGNQREQLCLWYTTDTDCDTTGSRLFRVAGTGHPLDQIPPVGRFLGTVLFAGGSLVLHVFEFAGT